MLSGFFFVAKKAKFLPAAKNTCFPQFKRKFCLMQKEYFIRMCNEAKTCLRKHAKLCEIGNNKNSPKDAKVVCNRSG